MRVCSPVRVQDLAAFDRPFPKTVALSATIVSAGPAYNGPVRFAIAPHAGDPAIWTGTTIVHVPAGGSATASVSAAVPSAKLWDIGQPNLYVASATVGSQAHSALTTTFGFRWFTAEGVGTNAKLTLNGRRIVVKSSISWGVWAPNGLFPDRAAAEREVEDVQALGLNCIQNHRHMPKAVVLDAFDHAGLMRYCEAGAGSYSFQSGKVGTGPIDTSGAGGAPADFTSAYELDKLLAMVKSFRSHPAVPVWCVQNEVSPDLHNPAVFYVLRQLHAADPSRILVLKSGVGTEREAWMMPFSSDVLYDNGDGVSGWHDQHTATSSCGAYADEYYKSPTDYIYHSTDTKEISMWGEMATSASTDNYALDLAFYKDHGITSAYNLDAARAVNSAYAAFLSKYGFQSAFPTTSALFQQIGDKHYEMDAKMLENGRICDANDYLVLSGWESTTGDDHSGMVDSLRLLKGDPGILKAAAANTVLVVRARHYVVAKGDPAMVDIHLVNEGNLHGAYTLTVTAADDGANAPFYQNSFPVIVLGGDVFGQLLKHGVTFTAPKPGYVTVKASLSKKGDVRAALVRTEPLLVVDTAPAPLSASVAIAGVPDSHLADALKQKFGVTASSLSPATGKVDVIVASADSSLAYQTYRTTDRITGTDDPALYQQQRFGGPSKIVRYTGLPNGAAKVELFFAETYQDGPGKRMFDVALNGQTVLKNFDTFQESGGKDRAIVKTFTVDVPDGTLSVSVPAVAADNASFAAIRVTDADGKVIRQVFRNETYKDPSGDKWTPVIGSTEDLDAMFADPLRRVHDDGTRLVVLTSADDGSDSNGMARELAQKGVLSAVDAPVGQEGPSWMGFWYFGRKHWLLSGLPSDCVLDWQYQIQHGNGLRIDAPGMDVAVGFGRDHDPDLGIGAAVVPYGKGTVVLFCMPGLGRAFTDDDAHAFDPVTATRIVYNALSGPMPAATLKTIRP
jgi:hypothetical protein